MFAARRARTRFGMGQTNVFYRLGRGTLTFLLKDKSFAILETILQAHGPLQWNLSAYHTN